MQVKKIKKIIKNDKKKYGVEKELLTMFVKTRVKNEKQIQYK